MFVNVITLKIIIDTYNRNNKNHIKRKKKTLYYRLFTFLNK